MCTLIYMHVYTRCVNIMRVIHIYTYLSVCVCVCQSVTCECIELTESEQAVDTDDVPYYVLYDTYYNIISSCIWYI